MDIMHKFFLVARREDAHGGLHEAHISTNSPRVLDLGCGTGIWAIDMAEYIDHSIIRWAWRPDTNHATVDTSTARLSGWT
jgi:methylase of polypeptide subunit release factors